jgi:hypothetical protein
VRKAGLWGAIVAAVTVAALAVIGASVDHTERPTMTTIQAQNGPCITEC